MKVIDLIEQLNKLSPNAPVEVLMQEDTHGNWYRGSVDKLTDEGSRVVLTAYGEEDYEDDE